VCEQGTREIATCTTLEHFALAVGDEQTAKLAASIRADEEKMLQRVLGELPKLTATVARADVEGKLSYDVTTSGAADAVREVGNATIAAARKATATAKRNASQAAAAAVGDVPIAGYDDLTADQINSKLTELSQVDLANVETYERAHQDRSTVLGRISSLRGDLPWDGYDELTVDDIRTALDKGDDELNARVSSYERAHKNRVGVLTAAERQLSHT
jgi:hypothetical protein